MRQLYTLIFSALLPLILLRLVWRSVKQKAYRQRWRERLGIYPTETCECAIWFHAVSVGEAEAAAPLIKLLQNRHPEARFLVTTTTPTGSARVTSLLGSSVAHVYLPYDLPIIVNRFLNHFQPKMAVMLEKEIWPNLVAACAKRQMPFLIVNARLSARSAAAYQKIPSLIKPALQNISLIATQTQDDLSRFISIGAKPDAIKVLGNTKFDVPIEAQTIAAGQALKQDLFADRYVLIIGSSHQGEEEVFLKLYPHLKTSIPSLLLVIVPRHPERFQKVKKRCQEQQLEVQMRSQGLKIANSCDAYIADTMGELKMLYAAADIAFVAGSLAPIGGHNVLEPAAVNVPVLFGPYMFNFQEIAERMLAIGGAISCDDAEAISNTVLQLYRNPECRQTIVIQAKNFIEQNQGATQRIADFLEAYFCADW